VVVKKIATRRPDYLASDTFCKVKDWEKYLRKGVALARKVKVK
jgi:hypothetical protein